MTLQSPSKSAIARTFARKAGSYKHYAVIQRTILEKLTTLLCTHGLVQSPLFDFGCGAGMLHDIVAEQQIVPSIVGIDLSNAPLVVYRANHPGVPCIMADIEHLPLQTNSVPFAVVASVLQWVSDINNTVNELARVIIPQGYLVFSIFLKGTCNELCALREKNNLPNPVHYLSLEEAHDILCNAGFDIVCMEYMNEILHFTSARDILQSISNIGGTAVAGPHLTRKQLTALCAAYENTYVTPNGIPLTYSMALGIARKKCETL